MPYFDRKVKILSTYRIYRKDRRIFLPQIPSSKFGVRRSFQVQTATSQQPFRPGLCVPLSRAHLSRLRLTQQSLKRVGHEGKLCLKVEQGHPPCLSKVPLSKPAWGVIQICGVHTTCISRQLTASHHSTGSTEPFWCLPL